MNILHLEDDDSDAALFDTMLAREWPACRIDRMWTRQKFETALQTESYDLILSDHSMPGFDGLTALEIARGCTPDTPFIFLSGTIGEERAIEAMKRGAKDYVLKDASARFITAVRGALADSEREVARRRAEESLRENREQFRQIAESIDDFIVLVDATGRCNYANPAFSRLLQCRETVVSLNIFDRVHPADRARFREIFDRAARQRIPVDLEYRVVLPDGSIRYLETRARHTSRRGDEAATMLLAGRDVTERKQAEQTLQEQASLLGKARDAVYLLDLQFTVEQWNASAERIYGIPASAAIGRNARQLLFRNQGDRFDAAYTTTVSQGEWQGDFRLVRFDGCDLVVESSWSLVNDADGRPKSILCIDTDVTQRKQLEQELQRSQRIEGLGMLAGGIAHDLNNILSPILMSVGLLRPLARNGDELKVLDTLASSACHGTDLVRQILLFARGGDSQRSDVHLGVLLKELEGFLKTVLQRTIRLRLHCDQDIRPISADATQLKQVLMNLCVNARDAMVDEGLIRVEASNVDVVAGTRRGFHGEIAAGSYVLLSVSDSGTGIPPAVLEKIFDPFFTTKEVGKGTGLGLSTVAGIVLSHEGAIQVESAPGHGTTFNIYLPARRAVAPPVEAPVEEESIEGHGETILIIDDDEGIRLVVEQVLIASGYQVCVASDGPSGLEEFKRQRDRIKLVISDYVMPGLNGITVLELIGQECPEVKLILMSGDDVLSNTRPRYPITALPKPLTADMLLRAVRQAIDLNVS